MKNILNTALMITTLTIATAAQAERWDRSNDPANFESDYEYRLSALPLQGIVPVKTRPWSDSFWPRNKGSINYRWNAKNPNGFDNELPTREQVMKMSAEELATLSPAEKFDLVQGHYQYPFTREIAAGVTPAAKSFEGLCDGWSAAAIQFPEPNPVEIKNPDGVSIPFGSSDVKALMSYYSSLQADLDPVFVGSYCLGGLGIKLGSGRCSDINPGAYHVILANEIGLRGRSFVADVELGKETWNQPVFGFDFEIVGSSVSRNGGKAYQIKAKMMYTEDDPDAGLTSTSWTPVVGTDRYRSETQEVEYILETDANDRIIGGSWITKLKHPDLFWKPTRQIEFKGGFEMIQTIYNASQARK